MKIQANCLVLGAGIAGLSASYHLGHKNCVILEKDYVAFGHARSYFHDDAIWDEGPHVSFTKHEYVRKLLAASVEQKYEEFSPVISNWFNGLWITHPVQTNLYQLPPQLARQFIADFVIASENRDPKPSNYDEWLRSSLGAYYTDTFARPYTRKYWTVEPIKMGTDWVGERVYRPAVDEVLEGSRAPLTYPTHYVKCVRYPSNGGFQGFFTRCKNDANIELNADVVAVDLEKRAVKVRDGRIFEYERLINTLPLPRFVEICTQSTSEMIEAARELACTKLHLINCIVPHEIPRSENWMYVYDENILSTRITFTKSLAKNNVTAGWGGIQVEIYESCFRPHTIEMKETIDIVLGELVRLGLTHEPQKAKVHWRTINHANIIFTTGTSKNVDQIFSGLEPYGLMREHNDTNALTNWDRQPTQALGSLVMAGRFAQWKYFWSDDCILRGRAIAEQLSR